MVFSGTLDISRHLTHAATMPSLETDAVEIANVEMLEIFMEIDDHDMEGLLPAALHPTIPPTVHFIGMRAPGGPLGAFTFAQVRVGARAGVRPRGYTTLCYCDAEEASEALASRWGFPVTPGAVTLQRNYDRVLLNVDTEQGRILDAELLDPLPISGFDVQFTASVNLARASHDGPDQPWLVQVDPDMTIRRADRGRPRLRQFDQDAWLAQGVEPVYPITGAYVVADITLPALRYLMDPAKPAFQGTVTL